MVVHGGCNIKLVIYGGKWRESGSSWGKKLISPIIRYISIRYELGTVHVSLLQLYKAIIL